MKEVKNGRRAIYVVLHDEKFYRIEQRMLLEV